MFKFAAALPLALSAAIALTHGALAQDKQKAAQPVIKRGAMCDCAKQLYGIERINGFCQWNARQAEAIQTCAAKKSG